MSTGDLLNIQPDELKFPFELKKQISCSLQLLNKTEHHVAFKVKTTNPKKYCVRPNTGIVLPRSTCDVVVTMQAQREAPPDMLCKDKFLIQSVIASPGATTKDVNPEMFNKESGNLVEECKLKVLYVSPPKPPSPVHEGSEEGSSPTASLSDNNHQRSAFETVLRHHAELKDTHSDSSSVISKLTEEKNSAIQQNSLLRQELELLRREASKRRGGFPYLYAFVVALFGILLGFLMRR
ncbi:vesicle-associated protein 1-1 isoform X2 [Amborella trichopoda]|uniref:vesicle-associated protein 1-1 isoform X2 n=1 Tax=Amborella trichopoda TaxID=13333 RepID=UPI0005D335A2|nr:vesicle-associated protein 1-1 isoform X2 [Amborella trichopoda]|eukprot:XP_011621356.1 vesicle-associated protein 1-1 isoform X2 [Amborella trichopoda]